MSAAELRGMSSAVLADAARELDISGQSDRFRSLMARAARLLVLARKADQAMRGGR